MDFNSIINGIESKEDFIDFMYKLQRDKEDNSDSWENNDISAYLEGISSWVEDMEAYYKNTGKEVPKDIDWKFIATLLHVGKIYE